MNSNRIVARAVSALLASLSVTAVDAGQDSPFTFPFDSTSRIRIGFAFADRQGIPLDLHRKNRALVGLGSYLVNAAGGCNDCHTAPPFTEEGDPYAYLGAPMEVNVPCYLAGGTPFGPIVSSNLTPWNDGKPAGLTFRQFLNAMRTGEDPNAPGEVLQVMPWPVYRTLTDLDLRAIYEYLRAVPGIDPGTCGEPSG